MSQTQQDAAVQSIANVSRLLRQAIGASIPVSPDQYLTISIPGTVIDTTDISNGGTFVYDASKSVVPPMQVQQAEARLVDGMMPLAYVMIGNTGKSVARSYSRALDALLPVKATVNSGNQIRSPGNALYDQAMTYLTAVNPETGLTPVDVYTMKQSRWAAAQDRWDQAKIAAQADAVAKYSGDLSKQVQYYNEWNQSNFRKYKFAVQGEWMDWVTNGHKYDVEYNFGLVDVDSIMSLVENSKESMRDSSIVDADGANEVQAVSLTPKNWATLCRNQINGWYRKNGEYSLDQLNAEISRLTLLQGSYATVQEAVDKSEYPGGVAPTPEDSVETNLTNVKTKLGLLLTEQGNLNKGTGTEALLNTARRNLGEAEQSLQLAQQKQVKYDLAAGDDKNKAVINTWLQARVKVITDQLAALEVKKAAKMRDNPPTIPVPIGAHDTTITDPTNGSIGTDIAAPGTELAAPVFGVDIPVPDSGPLVVTQPTDVSNPWTTITCSYSASDQSKTESESTMGFSVGGSVGYGLWSVGGSYSHEQARKDMAADMASCDVNISFSALVVNINRPWLYGELFHDPELDTAQDYYLSAGPEAMQAWMKEQDITSLSKYNEFPAYPTSFIIAADTEIEFNGNTSHIESHLKSSSNAATISVGYGPWSVNSSFHNSSMNSSFRMSTTATGCKLCFASPQIIGWVSQILPQLPRDARFEPMVQNLVT